MLLMHFVVLCTYDHVGSGVAAAQEPPIPPVIPVIPPVMSPVMLPVTSVVTDGSLVHDSIFVDDDETVDDDNGPLPQRVLMLEPSTQIQHVTASPLHSQNSYQP